MEAKKVNIFAFLMVAVMCAVSIFVCFNKKDNAVDYTNDILAIYKKLDDVDDEFDEVDEKIAKSQGKSAYEIAQDNGFTGTEAEWLLSLKGTDGTNALASVTTQDIFEAYKEAEHKDTGYTYAEFLTYYYSVMEKYDTETATSLALRSTVDICYSYTNTTYYVQKGTETSSGKTAYKLDTSKTSGAKGGVAAGAGVIYQMFDSNTDDDYAYDTAYIITNYHVAYLENYTNDSDYVVYYDSSTSNYFLGTLYETENLTTVNSWGSSYQYFLEETIEILSTDEGISKHFLNGTNDEYYGIYVYDYQEEQYKINATFVGGSAENDIAILKVERSKQDSQAVANIFFGTDKAGSFVPASIGDSTNINVGEEIIAVGNPLIANTYDGMTLQQYKNAYIDALVLSSTSGIVSSVSDEVLFTSLIDSSKTSSMRLIRVDAAINSGNSGGGLYDLYGNLVGIVNSKIASSSYDNVGFAIPINIAVNIADQVIAQCDGISPTSLNTRIKVFDSENLGFKIANGDTKTAYDETKKEWNNQKNVVVKITSTSGLAFTSGLLNDDIITEVSFGGKTYSAELFFNTDYELNDLLLKVALTDASITFKVARVGESSTLEEPSITITLNSSCFAEIA